MHGPLSRLWGTVKEIPGESIFLSSNALPFILSSQFGTEWPRNKLMGAEMYLTTSSQQILHSNIYLLTNEP